MTDRTLDWLIRILPDTTELNKVKDKIKKIDMGEFIQFTPTEAKKLKKILEREVNDVGAQAGSIGKKLQDGLAKGLDTTKLQELFDIDTKKLKETMDIVGKLTDLISKHSSSDSWLKDGKGFLDSLLGADQKLSALETSLGNLETKFNGLDTLLASTIEKFDVLEQKISSLQGASGKVVSPFNFDGASKEVDAEVKKIQDALGKLSNGKSRISVNLKASSSLEDFSSEVAKIGEALQKAQDDIEKFEDAAIEAFTEDELRQANIGLANAYIERAKQYKRLQKLEGVSATKTRAAMKSNSIFGNPEDMFREMQQGAEKAIGQLLNNMSGDASAIGIAVKAPSADDIINVVNKAIAEINASNKLNKIKINVDDKLDIVGSKDIVDTKIINQNKEQLEKEISDANARIAELNIEKANIENEISESKHPNRETVRKGLLKNIDAEIKAKQELIAANKDLLAKSDDQVVQQSLSSTMKSFDSIGKVIDSRQEAILSKTQDWRRKMMAAMSLDKGDVNIQLGFDKGLEASLDVLYNEVNKYFEDNQIELHINKDSFIQEIKDAVESGGVSVGTIGGGVSGGTVSLDAASLTSAFATAIQGLITGDFTPINTEPKQETKQTTSEQNKPKTVYLDPENAYIQDKANALKNLAEYAQGSGAPAAKVREFFSNKGIDLKPLVDGTIMDLKTALEDLVRSGGATLLDEFDNLIGGTKNKLLTDFRGELRDLLYTQNIGQVSIDEDTRRRLSVETFGDYAGKYMLTSGMKGFWNNTDSDKWQPPEMEEIDKLIDIATKQNIVSRYTSVLDEDGNKITKAVSLADDLKAFKQSLINIGDLNDENNRTQLLSTIENFKLSVYTAYKDLNQYVASFEMDVDVKGMKKPYRVEGHRNMARTLAAMEADNLSYEEFINTISELISDVRIYKDTSTGTLGVSRQERMLNRGYGTKDNLIVPYPDRTDILHRDRSIDDWSLSDKTIARWEDSKEGDVAQTQARVNAIAEQAEERRRQSAEVASQHANKQKQITDKIVEIESKIATTETEIAANQARIDELSGDGRKLAGARKRLDNRKKTLDATKSDVEIAKQQMDTAQKELDIAKESQKVANSIDYSERDTKTSVLDSNIKKYQSWLKKPEKHQQEIYNELYKPTIDMHKRAIEAAQIKELQALQALAKETDPKKQRWLQTDVDLAKKERELHEDAISQLRANISGKTDADKQSYRKYLEKQLIGYVDEDGNKVLGRLSEAIEAKNALGVDQREVAAKVVLTAQANYQNAEKNYQKADKAYQSAQQAYSETAADADVIRATELADLKENNKQLEQSNVALMESVEEMKAQHAANEANKVSTKDMLNATAKMDGEADIDKLMQDAESLQKKVAESRAEAENVDRFIKDTLADKEYQKSRKKYDIGLSKKDQSKIDKYNEYTTRSKNLSSFVVGKIGIDDVPTNLTKEMDEAVSALHTDRLILNELSELAQFDDFDEKELQKFINKRLASSAGKNEQLYDVVQEFYDLLRNNVEPHIIKQWLQDSAESYTNDANERISKIQTFSKQDEEAALKLKPELEAADERFKKAYQNRIKSWFVQIGKNVKDIDSGKLNNNETALAYKEIEQLFELIEKAMLEYRTAFGSEIELAKKHQYLLNRHRGLVDGEDDFKYTTYKSGVASQYDAESADVSGSVGAYLEKRMPALNARRYELLQEIKSATASGKSTKKLETELVAINEELAKYELHKRQIAESDSISLFYNDADTLGKYKSGLAEIINLEQQADLAIARGASDDEVNAIYSSIDAQRIGLDDLIYQGRVKKRDGLLAQIKQRSSEGKSTSELEESLKNVNKLLTDYEIKQRRLQEFRIGGLLYKADVTTVHSYNEELEKTLKLEQEIALLEAKGESTTNVKDALRKQKKRLENRINRANEDRATTEAANSPRAQALDYLSRTDKAYKTAQQARYTAKRRKAILERQQDDIRNDDKYSTSWQYRKHMERIKDEKVNEYVSSDDYQVDRENGFKRVEEAFKARLIEVFGDGKETEEIRNRVLYEFMNNQHGKTADYLDPEKFKETYGNMVTNGDYIDTMRKSLEEEYKNSQEYKDLVAERQNILQRQLKGTGSKLGQAYEDIDAGRVSQDAELQKKLDAVDAATISYIEDVKKMTESDELLKTEIDKLLVGVDVKDKAHYDSLVEKARGRLITEAQNMVVDTKKAEAYKHYGSIAEEDSKPFFDEYNASLQKAITDYVRDYVDKWVQTAFTDEDFANLGGDKAKELAEYFKQLLEENVYGLVSNYSKGLEVKNGVIGGVNVRDEIDKRIAKQIEIIEGEEKKIDSDITHIEEQRKAAMKDGGIGYKEVADAEVLKEQAMIEGRLEMATERRKEILEQIAILEKEGGQSKEIERLNTELDKTEEKINKLTLLYDSRDTLLDLQHEALRDEKAAEKWDPEKQRLYYMSKIENAESQMETADDATRKELEQRIHGWKSTLEKIDGIITTRQAEEEDAKKNAVRNAIKDMFGGGVGGIGDTDGLATEDTLQQILQAITGGRVSTVEKDPEMEAKLARIKELKAELGVTGSKTQGASALKHNKRSTKDNPDYILNARAFDKKELAGIKTQDELSVIAKKLVGEIEGVKQGTKEAIELQLKLQKVVNKSGELYKASSGNKSYKTEEIGKILGIGDKISLKISESNAKKAEEKGFAESEKQVANEKKKTAETAKQVENQKKETAAQSSFDKNKKDVVVGTSINDLKAGQKDSYAKYISDSVGNYKTSDAIFSDKNALQAKVKELQGIMLNSATDSEEYLKAMVEMSRLIATWRSVVKKTKPEMSDDAKWKQYLTKGRGKLFDSPEDVPAGGITSKSKTTLKQKAMELGTKVGEDAKNKIFTVKEDVKPAQQKAEAKEREAAAEEKITEEKKEQKTAETKPDSATQAKRDELARLQEETKGYKPNVVYDDSEFSGVATENTLRAILGLINKIVTNGVPKNSANAKGSQQKEKTEADIIRENAKKAITPNRPEENIGALADKIAGFQQLFDAAKQLHYLGEKDDELKDFNRRVEGIKNALQNGGSFADVEKLFVEAVNVGEKISKTVNKNKKLYFGSTEMNAAKTQRANLDARGVLVNKSLTSVHEYNKAYGALIAKHNKFKINGTLYDTSHQKTLQTMAIRVKDLGKALEKSASEAEQLKRLVEDSGYYNGKRMGGYKELNAEETANLDATMRKYLQTLGLGNIENIKFDNVNKRLTGTLRTSSTTVADLEMKYNDATNALYLYNKQERESLTGFPAFVKGFKGKIGSILQYTASITSIYRVISMLRQGVQYIREIDSALTELKKVTDATEETYDKFLNTAAKTADKVGSTIKEVVSSTADFARLGYSIQEATQMAETAQVLMNVSEFTDISTATDSLISSIQAFKYTAEESMDVVDILNTIGNNYAISTADLATSLTKSSGSLVAANGTLEEAVALTATANTIIQDADVVGTALKTVAMRLRGTDTKIMEEEGLDTDGAVTSKSKLQSKIKGLSGVDILTDAGAYKSTYQILSEIANVWEDINDMDQAALLELLAGKRAGSVMSAILQNPDTLKDAFESANDASGSAMKENEKYLDSIQGRIDLFNNAVQTMWSNTLDDAWVKGVVDAATWVVKLASGIDVLGVEVGGLIPTLITIASIFAMIKNKMSPIEFFGGISNFIRNTSKNVVGFISSLTGMSVATSAYTAETLSAAVANGTLSASEAASIASKNGLALATTNLTAAEASEMLIRAGVAKSDAVAMVAKLGLTNSTKSLSLADIQAAVASGALTTAQGAQISSALGLTAANTGLTASLTALWAVLWPMLAVVGAIAAIWALWTKVLDPIINKTEKLSEELSNMKTELSEIQSELDSVDTELEKVHDRMEELLALPSLSFVEQEELKKLRQTEESLERAKDVLTAEEERTQKRAAEKAQETVDSKFSDTSWDGDALSMTNSIAKNVAMYTAAGTGIGALFGGIGAGPGAIVGAIVGLGAGILEELTLNRISTEDKLNREIDEYDGLIQKKKELQDKLVTADQTKGKFLWWETDSEYDKVKKELDKVEDEIKETEEYIDATLGEIGSELDGIEYGQGADDALDFYNQFKNRWEITYGSDGAKSTAIESVISKDKYAELSNKIDVYVKKLKDGDESAAASIESLINNNTDFVNELKANGIELKDALDYFTLENGIFNSDTVKGIALQYNKGKRVMQQFAEFSRIVFDVNGETKTINFDDLFEENEDGKFTAKKEEFSEMLKGMDEDARTTFISLAEKVKNSALTWNQAMDAFDAYGLVAALEVVNSEISDINSEMFSDVADELSGLIDTFGELSSVLESTAASMDLLKTAQDQYNNSGRVSVKTALELMQSTDNWNDLLEIEDGNIRLVNNAEEILIQSKLDHIKVNLQNALSTVKAQIAAVEATGTSANFATTLDESTNIAVQELSKSMITLVELMKAYKDGTSTEDALAAADEQIAKLDERLNAYKGPAVSKEESLSSLYKQQANLETMLEMYEGIDTTSEYKNNYDFDKTPGDKYKDDTKSDKFQKEMDYWENRIGAEQSRFEQIQNEVDLLEKQGKIAGEGYYEEQIASEQRRLELLKAQKEEAQKYLKQFKIGSDDWWEVANTLNDIESEMDDVTASIQDLSDAQAEVDWKVFDETHERYGSLIDDLDTIRELISPNGEEDWFDSEGLWTEKGVASLATYIQQLEMYENAFDEVTKKLNNDYSLPYAGNETHYKDLGIDSEQELYDAREKLIDQQYEYRKDISDTQQSVADMYESQIDSVEEYTSELIDSYNDYIDVVKEALDAERD